ncbi:MAG TPA: prolyl oligopeptidase family serine peptidase [Phototrophicaceae bacterium]|nr:prolyl oligopeptidase family serine peptidase [Phototrophicaceae bacterium]
MAEAVKAANSAAKRPRAYWLRLLRLFAVALVVTLGLAPFLMGLATIWGLTHPPCSMGVTPADFGLTFEEISFGVPQRNLTQNGYFIPATNGATLIVVPAFNGGRGSSLHYANVFHQAGFNVLTFNSRVCAAHGWISLGYQEVEDVQAAYEYLKTRPDVNPNRVGLHGFSSAGSTSLMAMPRIPELRSVSAEGGYHDYAALLGVGQAATFFDALYQAGVTIGYRLVTGADLNQLNPYDAIGQIGPRAVLLVYGSREVTLPGARLMLERALQNGVKADLWVVEGAGHGEYLALAPDEFVRRVVGFHEAALLDEAES